MKTLSIKYEIEDAQNQAESSTNASESKKKTLEEWVMYRVKCQTALESKSKLRESITGKDKSNVSIAGAVTAIQEWIEDEVVEEIEKEIEKEIEINE